MMDFILKILKLLHLIEPENVNNITPIEDVIDNTFTVISDAKNNRELDKVERWITEALEPYLTHRAFDRYFKDVQRHMAEQRKAVCV